MEKFEAREATLKLYESKSIEASSSESESMEKLEAARRAMFDEWFQEGSVSNVNLVECIRAMICAMSSARITTPAKRWLSMREQVGGVMSDEKEDPEGTDELIARLHEILLLDVPHQRLLPWRDGMENFPMSGHQMRRLLINLNHIYELATELINGEVFPVLDHKMKCLLIYLDQIFELAAELIKDASLSHTSKKQMIVEQPIPPPATDSNKLGDDASAIVHNQTQIKEESLTKKSTSNIPLIEKSVEEKQQYEEELMGKIKELEEALEGKMSLSEEFRLRKEETKKKNEEWKKECEESRKKYEKLKKKYEESDKKNKEFNEKNDKELEELYKRREALKLRLGLTALRE